MGEWTGLHIYGYRIICKCSALHDSSTLQFLNSLHLHLYILSVLPRLHCTISTLYTTMYRFFKSLWRSVLTSLIVSDASVTTIHCVAGVLWSTSVLGGPSARMQQTQGGGCRTPVSASQLQSPPTSLSWITLRL